MSVTSFQLAEKDRYLSQIDKIVHSHSLRKAESLCKLLLYLADHSLTHPGVSLKEYQIATEVFGRPKTFDPQTDAAIRVQAGRLRLKLAEYYTHEGAADPIIVEMPNGVYALTFHEREIPSPHPVPVASPEPATPPIGKEAPRKAVEFPAPRKSGRRWVVAVAVLSVALIAAVLAIVSLSSALKSARLAKGTGPIPDPVLRTFWTQFVSGPAAPRVIFSNAAFVGRPETGMRYMDPAHDTRGMVYDHYTGVGEVIAVHELDKVFEVMNSPIELKRGSLFTLDEAKENNLIFVGSPAENLTLRDVPGSKEFVFKRVDSGPHKGELGIANVHPEQGEETIFYPSNPAQPLTEDYAIIALMPGLNPERHMLILAGTTTIGTQAAVEYVCSRDSLDELLGSLSIRSTAEMKPFEALLRVKVTRGVPIEITLLAVRRGK